MYSKGFKGKSPQFHWGTKGFLGGQLLEGNCTLGEVFLSRETNTGYPSLSLRVETFKEAEGVLLLNQLSRRHTLELLAKIVSANLSISSIEEEKHVLLLIFYCVEFAGTLSKGLISKGGTLSQVTNRAIVTCDFGHVVLVLEAVKSFACHKHLWRRNTTTFWELTNQSLTMRHLPKRQRG